MLVYVPLKNIKQLGMLNKLLLQLLAVLIWMNSCTHPQEPQQPSNNFVRAEAPDALTEQEPGYLLPGLEHGLLQSPVNIRTKEIEHGQHEVTVHYTSSHAHIAYLGHTVEVVYDEGSSLDFDRQHYDFKQFHFHTPSEHHIDGITYPLEMHMVHQAPNDTLGKPQYLVIGILFKEGSENPFLNEFIDAIPPKVGQVNELPQQVIDVNDLIHGKLSDGYFYRGSLTTPPFTESVQWLVVKEIYEASPDQIERLNRMEGNNARHIQALFGRKIEG